MTTIDLNNPDDLAEAKSYVRNYTPSAQEQTEETAEQADTSPLTDSERDGLDEATRPSFDPLTDGGEVRDRAETFQIPGQWVHPAEIQRRKSALMLQSRKVLDDLDGRVSAVTRFGGLPEDVTTQAQRARLTIGAARETYESAQSPDNPRFAISVAAKDAVQVKIGEAAMAVGALESMARDETVQQVQFDALVSDLDKQRDATLKALRTAEKHYAGFRRTVDEANAVAIATGRWDSSWHSSVVLPHEISAPLAKIREAIGWLEGDDDFTSGRFLTEEYEGIPPHTLARLKRGAEAAGGASFAAQVYQRAINPMADDVDAQAAIATKSLITLLNSSPFESKQPDEI